MVEEQLKWFTAQFSNTVLPRELLRSHLHEVISPDILDEQSSYSGNRLAACTGMEHTLIFSCCGSAGHKIALNVLDGDRNNNQVRHLPQYCHCISCKGLAASKHMYALTNQIHSHEALC